MIRNLKVLLLAALAVTAFGALTSAAQAAKFTAPGAGPEATTTLDLKTDGAGKTAHHVFIIGNTATTTTAAFTCESLFAEPSHSHIIGPENTDVTITPRYNNCNIAGQVVKVENTGCIFTFTADGKVHVTNDTAAVCAHGKQPIDITFTNCKVEVGAQTIEHGISYHNVGTEVTVEANVLHTIVYNAVGAACPFGTTSNGSYTTGNTLVDGTRPAGTTVAVQWDAI